MLPHEIESLLNAIATLEPPININLYKSLEDLDQKESNRLAKFLIEELCN